MKTFIKEKWTFVEATIQAFLIVFIPVFFGALSYFSI